MRRRASLIAAVAVALLAVVVFAPVRRHDFVALDDYEFVVDNPHVQQGLNAAAVRWAFSPANAYVATGGPVTWLSHMLDVEIFSMAPGPAHVVNLAWHALNAVLLFLLLARMTAAPWRSLVVAALFAVHPLHVESVAWISERKDVLSLTCWLLATAAYVRYARRPRAAAYAGVVMLFSLGLMAKPVVVMLPVTLLLLDVWPLGRATLAWADRARWRPLVIEKVPLFVLGGAAIALAFFSQRRLGAVAGDATLGWAARVANAVVSCVAYLVKTVWPSHLAVFYPYPAVIRWPSVAASAFVLAALSVVAWRARRARPYVTVGWLWYLVTLVPMIGLVQVGSHAMADRFTYVPLIGVFVAIVWTMGDAAASLPAGRAALSIAAVVVIAAFAAVARVQVDTWQDSESLWRHALAVTDGNFRAYAGLAEVEAARGRLDAAVADYQRALRLAPDAAEWHVNLGLLYVRQDRVGEAASSFERALQLAPNDGKTHNNLGSLYAREGRRPEAIAEYRRSIALMPDYALAHRNLSLALAATGDLGNAVGEELRALQLDPAEPQWHYEAAVMLIALNRRADAIDQLRLTLQLAPEHEAAKAALATLGR